MAIDPTGNFLYSTGVSDNAISVLARNPSTGVLTDIACYSPTDTTDCVSAAAQLHPYALLIAPDDPTTLST
jgi:6-phosphogluconolactonase (cycloisomerase 2 family)